MSRKRFTPEQIITKLREAEVELAKGQRAVEVCRKIGVAEQTYYRWRREYGGLRVDQARRLKVSGRRGVVDMAHFLQKLTQYPLREAVKPTRFPTGRRMMAAKGTDAARCSCK